MNLHNIVRGAITRVNPDIPVTLLRSTGYTVDANRKQIPQYETLTGMAQVQGIDPRDLEHVNNMGIQGNLRTVYLYDNWYGMVRSGKRGGDIIRFPMEPGGEDCDWLVVTQKEIFPNWCSVIVWLQQ
ncbi:MAG: hypothetical protein LBK01_09080 [Burkholderiaceae bacterium]|jgi:hypothetical protein|nr:hypothetical protein [Burkholderiaceae bacterium]